MRGFVRYINLRNAMAAVETPEGFAVIEVLECCALDISDQLDGPLDAPGTEVLRNVSKNEDFHVSIKNTHCSRTDALELIEQ
ncbi:MAG TPA: hypothetical protein VGJ94_15145 [Syntrophorhabdaceae bacterium]|jgi:hypothetical protein